MYRYLLFFCPHYYPGGGMIDCSLKTNNLDELKSFINANYDDEWMCNIHCYDAVEDKVYDAIMETYLNSDYCTRQRFVKWEER